MPLPGTIEYTATRGAGGVACASNSLGIEITLLLPTRRTFTTFIRQAYTWIAEDASDYPLGGRRARC